MQLFIGNDDDLQHSIIGSVLFKCDPGETKINGVCMPKGSLLDTTTTSSPVTTSKSSATITGPLDLNLVFIVIFAQAIFSLHV